MKILKQKQCVTRPKRKLNVIRNKRIVMVMLRMAMMIFPPFWPIVTFCLQCYSRADWKANVFKWSRIYKFLFKNCEYSPVLVGRWVFFWSSHVSSDEMSESSQVSRIGQEVKGLCSQSVTVVGIELSNQNHFVASS